MCRSPRASLARNRCRKARPPFNIRSALRAGWRMKRSLAKSSSRPARTVKSPACATWRGCELAARDYTVNSQLGGKAGHRHRHLPASRFKRARHLRCGAREDGRAQAALSRRARLQNPVRPDDLGARVDSRSAEDALRSDRPRRARRPRLSPKLARGDHPADCDSRLAHRHFRGHDGFWFFN